MLNSIADISNPFRSNRYVSRVLTHFSANDMAVCHPIEVKGNHITFKVRNMKAFLNTSKKPKFDATSAA